MAVYKERIGRGQDRASKNPLSIQLRKSAFNFSIASFCDGSHQSNFSIDAGTFSESFEDHTSSARPPTPQESSRSSNQETLTAAVEPCSKSENGVLILSAFLALPIEIRRVIYYHVLLPSPEYRQVLRPLRAKYPNSWWGTEEMSRILRVSKQLKYEAEDVLYRSFEFCFQDTTPYQIEGFLRSVSPRARGLIKSVSCCITMNGKVRDSIRRNYVENWKSCFVAMCTGMSGLRKVALQIRFLDGRSMRTTFMESIVDLVSQLDDGMREISLLAYDGGSSVDKQGAKIIEDCRRIIARHRADVEITRGMWKPISTTRTD